MTTRIAQQGVAYQVTLRLRHNFLLAGENAMLARMPLENPSFYFNSTRVSLKKGIISVVNLKV